MKENETNEGYKQLTERRCSRCGRIFVPAPYHAYKKYNYVFCSYGCYNSFLKERELLKKTRSSEKERGRK